MSAESATNRKDVSTDVAAGGSGAKNREADATGHAPVNGHSGGTDTSATGRSGPSDAGTGAGPQRRKRRGRRRRGRRSTANRGVDTADAHPAPGHTPPTAAMSPDKAAEKSVPKPGQRAQQAQRPQKATSEPERKPENPPNSGTRVSAPKPSDLVSVTAKITKPGLTHANGDTSTAATRGGRSRRRGQPPTPEPEQLRTVRETSAGGLVISGLGKPIDELSAALIGRVDRRGRMMWSLPKGHIETGETAEQTAIREVAEETGIQGTVVAPLGKIDYWFVSEGRRIHKTVHHYLLRHIGGELSDEDYEVSEVAWVPLRELPRRLTYSDERRLARMARGVIADLAADPHRLAKSEADSIRTEPNAYERAAAARNQRRNDPVVAPRSRRSRRRRARRPSPGDA